jgi:hypothetical protein
MFDRKRIRLIGVVLIMVSLFPIVNGMISAFTRVSEQGRAAQVDTQLAESVRLGLSPPFIAMSNLGILLVVSSFFMKKSVT